MPKVQNAKTPIPQRVILPNLFHQQLNLPEQNTNHSNKDITWSTPGHDWQNGWERIYVASTCRTDDSTKAAHFWFDDWFVFFMSSCFTNVIDYLSEYEYGVPNRVRTRLGEVSCLFPNQEDSAAPLSYAETVMPNGFTPKQSNAENVLFRRIYADDI